MHPEWNGDYAHGFDVGLLWLDRKAPFKKLIIDKTGDALQTQDILTAVSRSSTDEYKAGGELLLAENVTFIASSTCEDAGQIEMDDYMGCIGYHAGADHFHGAHLYGHPICRTWWLVEYSGAPLMRMDSPKGRLSHGKPQLDALIGIASFGLITCQEQNTPAVYTRVSAFWDWIEATMNKKTAVGCHISWQTHDPIYVLSIAYSLSSMISCDLLFSTPYLL